MNIPANPDPHEVAGFVQDLAEKGYSKKRILKELEDKHIAEVLDFLELQNAMEKGKLMRGMIPVARKYSLARFVGVLAILLGLGAILISLSSAGMPRRGRMLIYGITATVLGLVLLFKPSAGDNAL